MTRPMLICACSILALGTATAAFADAGVVAAPKGSGTVEEVVVTARKRGENVQDVPIPVTAVTGESLSARGVETTAAITRVTPNLLFDVSGLGGQSATIFLRGIGQSNFSATQDPKVGVYVDEVYLGRPESTVFDLFDVERVEVLRGPQGTLFGRNTTAGLVQIVTKSPTDEFGALVKVGGGNQGQWKFDGVVNVPLTDTLAVRVSAQRARDDGYVTNTASGRNWNDKNSENLRGTLLWKPGADFDARLTLDYSKSNTAPALGQCAWTGPADGSKVSPAASVPFSAYVFGVYDQIRNTCNATLPYRSSDNDPDRNSLKVWGAAGKLKWDLGFAELISLSSWRETDSKVASWGLATDTTGTASYLEAIQDQPSHQRQWSQEFRLQGDGLNDRLNWVLGLYAFDERIDSNSKAYFFRGVSAPTPAQSPIFYSPSPIPGFPTWGSFATFVQGALSGQRIYEVHNASQAAFAEASFKVTDRLSVTGGARYTQDERRFTRGQKLINGGLAAVTCPTGQAPVAGAFCSREKSYTKVTPRVIVSYDLADNVMLYSSWSQGYSSGGFNNGTSMSPYEPELSDNYEAGFKSELFDRHVVFNLSSFYNKYENQQLTVTRLINGRPEGEILNAQMATLYGVEGEFIGRFDNGLELNAQFGLVDGRYDRFTVNDTSVSPTPPFAQVVVKRDLSKTQAVPNSPYTYSLSAAYTHDIQGGGQLRGQVGWSYRGRQFNTLETLRTSEQKGFGLLDGRLTWTAPGGATTLSLWGTNLLSKKYFLDAADFSAGSSPLYTVTKYWAPPRRYGIELTHVFGKPN